ncbi:MAG TPA: hydrogenase maturation protease [Burkholderiales bacterium]|nr:hydrogenase maturation protease [Burkholderiales bacterium]
MTRVLVLGWGNPSRGDDAIGPRLLERLEAEAALHPEWGEHGFVTDFQLQPEHALDLEGASQVLFVDASASSPVPYGFARVQPAQDRSFSTHALSPQALLAVHAGLAGKAPPPAWLLAVRGERFELGAPMSAAAEARLEAAGHLAENLLSHPDPAFWDCATVGDPPCTS